MCSLSSVVPPDWNISLTQVGALTRSDGARLSVGHRVLKSLAK